MPHEPRPLRFYAAEGAGDPLVALGEIKQALYVRSYLFDLHCRAHVAFSPIADSLIDIVTQGDAVQRLNLVGTRVQGF